MSAATYHVGDVFDVMATLPDGSVDLVLTSPPFLALRSYLPDDHPDKAREIGSEPTPAEFLDTLLALTAEWDRLLAPHGSICVELGDTYSGGGGSGGNVDCSGKQTQHSRDTHAGSDRREGWPLAKSLCGIPTLYAWSLAYGRNLLTGEESPAGRWRIRNVVAWVRPNPPVGALGDKFRPATSYITIATKARDRWFDLDAVRTDLRVPEAATPEGSRPVSKSRLGTVRSGDMKNVGKPMMSNPAGAPPLDWWEVTTEPYSGSHYATWPQKLLTRPIESMCPKEVCRTCGEPRRRVREHLGRDRYADPPTPEEFGAEMVAAMGRAGMTDSEVAAAVGVTPWMVRHWMAATPTPQLPSLARWAQLSELLPFGDRLRESLLVVGREYETSDNGDRRIPERLAYRQKKGDLPKIVATGWTDCGHGDYRRGVVLDPFAGSGTTLAVATGLGRDAVGIDLNARNADLAAERVGMFLEVHRES